MSWAHHRGRATSFSELRCGPARMQPPVHSVRERETDFLARYCGVRIAGQAGSPAQKEQPRQGDEPEAAPVSRRVRRIAVVLSLLMWADVCRPPLRCTAGQLATASVARRSSSSQRCPIPSAAARDTSTNVTTRTFEAVQTGTRRRDRAMATHSHTDSCWRASASSRRLK